ncbi:MAG: histidinol-phosphate transaminase [Chloroflexi bacterium]|nr:histidinol-phosphate transaminase [Chloroflexota bacterium]
MGSVKIVHGGLDTAELRSLGLRPEQVLDFSANISPMGPSPRVRRAVADANLAAYPDRSSLLLRESLAARLNVGIDNLLVGNGSTELIHLLARSCLRPGEQCLIFTPTFAEYEAAATMVGAQIHRIQASEEQGFRWSLDTASATISELRPRLVFLCNPNNPTGVYLECDAVDQLRAAVGRDGLFVLDDAYASLAARQWDPLPILGSGNVAILRSLTKDHALAGVRLGYLVAQSTVVSTARQLQYAWSVNAVAQAAGVAALEDAGHVVAAREVVREAKAYLYNRLETLGIPVTASAANFLLANVGDATRIRTALLRRGIAVRDCTSFGLPEHVRIAARRPEECVHLVEALRDVLVEE